MDAIREMANIYIQTTSPKDDGKPGIVKWFSCNNVILYGSMKNPWHLVAIRDSIVRYFDDAALDFDLPKQSTKEG